MAEMTIEQQIAQAKRELDQLEAQQAAFQAQESEARTQREALAIPKMNAKARFEKLRDDLIRRICKDETTPT